MNNKKLTKNKSIILLWTVFTDILPNILLWNLQEIISF